MVESAVVSKLKTASSAEILNSCTLQSSSKLDRFPTKILASLNTSQEAVVWSVSCRWQRLVKIESERCNSDRWTRHLLGFEKHLSSLCSKLRPLTILDVGLLLRESAFEFNLNLSSNGADTGSTNIIISQILLLTCLLGCDFSITRSFSFCQLWMIDGVLVLNLSFLPAFYYNY